MIVLRSKNPIQWGTKPEDTDVLWLRIPAVTPNFLLKKVFVPHQYYRFADNVAIQVESTEEEIPTQMFDQLVSMVLQPEEDSLISDAMHTAFYKGALTIIGQKQKYNTQASDWEVVNVTEEDPLFNQHTLQVQNV